jgi:hypothetical protein
MKNAMWKRSADERRRADLEDVVHSAKGLIRHSAA